MSIVLAKIVNAMIDVCAFLSGFVPVLENLESHGI